MKLRYGILALTLLFFTASLRTVSAQSWVKLDTIKAGKFDTGRMWTFDFPPKKYFEEAYKFTPNDDWFDQVRMAALRFSSFCSASFVSEDGLVMTNHHCARESITEVQKEGEDLHENGFFAKKLKDERKVPDLYVDQLVKIVDVTAEVQSAMDKGATEAEKLKNRDEKKKEIEKRFEEESGNKAQVVTFYNGGKYSLYMYKRYKDVRLVFAPETQLGFFGGDPDNFTYPRYALDFSFFRVYDENGKPLKTKNFFKWNPKGAAAGEPVFVVGNPGTTTRLRTVAQLEYQRDIQAPLTVLTLQGLVDIYTKVVNANPPNRAEVQDELFGYSNSLKAMSGILGGLRDEVLMQKKRDFEAGFKSAVLGNPALSSKYYAYWDKIGEARKQMRKIAMENAAYNLSPIAASQYFAVAKNLIAYAKQLKKPEAERDAEYKGTALDSTVKAIFPADFNIEKADDYLALNLKMFSVMLGDENSLVTGFTGGKSGKDALSYCLANSRIATPAGVEALIQSGPDAILTSNDPFIKYIVKTADRGRELSAEMKKLQQKEGDYVQQLGRALFEVYGTNIPPDATFTLRIADGVVEGYDYNGTVTPTQTTFYGLYERYHSFNKQYPWNLPKRWEDPPKNFDLETPMCFVSTNDIIGGNSGSPVINKNAEVVGLAFDGNIESLPGQFIFDTKSNRTVSVHSAGLLEAVQDLYEAKRIAKELRTGKLDD